MATWCAACKVEIPELRRLRARFGEDELAMFGIPIDSSESRELVESWVRENQPPYALRSDLSAVDVSRVRNLVLDRLKFEAVPATILTDGEGGILRVQWGPPSISKLRELLATRETNDTCQENP
jgi:peroxiredoxin